MESLAQTRSWEDDVIVFDDEEDPLIITWGNIIDDDRSRFYEDDPLHIGYVRDSYGAEFDVILSNYPPVKLIKQLVKDVFQSQTIQFSEDAPFKLEGRLINFRVDGYQQINCHIGLELKVMEKKDNHILWQGYYETKVALPYGGKKLGLLGIHQDVVDNAFDTFKDKLKREDFLSKIRKEIYLLKFKSDYR